MVVGLIAGFLAKKVINKTGFSPVIDIFLGIVGGFIFSAIGHSALDWINIYSIFVALSVLSSCYSSIT